MDGKFLDVYNEVILDNFNAVLKQNFMFQTQLKFAEEKAKEVGELEKKLAVLTSENSDANILREEIKTLKETVSQKDAIIQSSSNTDNERHRLQTAVNNQMKEIEGLKKQIEEFKNAQVREIENLKKENDEHKNYIGQLEEMLPNSKKKKLGIELPEEQKAIIQEPKKPVIKEEDNILKFASTGGTF
jgi:hypothetical protein